ncbi:unnamed protein product [Rotaria magnacalcarata]|uniref:TIR domain-containing protein n=1 Tax=Rotaria magnacalcarata TaxID=392030 RepID=A0A816XCE6_9BILA|nr:unnamed protein product [Rotaria magnacalcarata]CAF1295748.1 unnamed protein product [Rotaria magnacalcarata]CAF1935861.1 unnamed protein product [Rotaria magnacalcarata]CAF2022321.1 unnamed protein product [Rotaria magnacalcarata]CAF2144494.1 unnamed protein product [Rotaria magnacalcarata]
MADDTPMDSDLNDENIDHYLSRLESTDAVCQPYTNEYPTSVTDLVIEKFTQARDEISETIKDENRLSLSTDGHLRTEADETSIVEEETITSGDQHQSSAEPLAPLPDPAQTQLSSVTTVNNQQNLQKNRHIMISYKHGICDEISEKIDKSLQDEGYRVWRDSRCLRGSIIFSMAKAVENSSIVLLLTNREYQGSHYCMMEAKYAVQKKIPYIPCHMEKDFKPSSDLAMIETDRKYVEFFPEKDFDASLRDLLAEIESMNEIENQTANTLTSSTETNINSLNTTMDSATTNNNRLDMSDRINKIISDYKNSIQKNHLQLKHLTKNELCKLMERLCQEISPDTLELFRNEHFNDDNNNADNSTQELEKFYEWMRKYLTEQDLKLEAIIRSQQEQQQNLSVVTQSLSTAMQSLSVVTQALLHQNEQIFQQLQTQQQQLTQLFTWKQQQQANNQNSQAHASNVQSVNNFNQNGPQIDQSDKQKDYFDTLVKLASTTILLWTMVALVKRS